jgi:TorA maturation chaperone TorD
MTEAQPLKFVLSLPPEEIARANFYGLLARLFYAPPDRALLDTLAGATGIEAEEGGIAAAWQELVDTAGKADLEAVRDEYDTVFVGTGKSPVTLYAAAYSIRYASEAPLAALRGDLAALGVARREGVNEPEDHIATLFDTMRHVIALQKRDLVGQSAFFKRWIAPSFGPLCNAIEQAPRTSFYKPVARFANASLTIEQTAFDML